MNTDQFCHWLKGYLDTIYEPLNREQTKQIKQRLNMALSDHQEFRPKGYPHSLIENDFEVAMDRIRNKKPSVPIEQVIRRLQDA